MRNIARIALQIAKNLPAALVWSLFMFIMVALGGPDQTWEE